MGKSEFESIDPKLLQEWEEKLKNSGMPAELPLTRDELHQAGFHEIVEFREEVDKVREMQDFTDDQIEEENNFGSAVSTSHLVKDLPPCKRIKHANQGG